MGSEGREGEKGVSTFTTYVRTCMCTTITCALHVHVHYMCMKACYVCDAMCDTCVQLSCSKYLREIPIGLPHTLSIAHGMF